MKQIAYIANYSKTLIFTLLFFVYASVYAETTSKPIAHKGVIDLREWNLAEKGSISLDGEWEFYWNKLLTPSQIKDNIPDGYIIQPCSWNDVKINNKEYPAYGAATYRLRILLNDSILDVTTRQLAFKLKQAHSASKIWVNNIQEIENGKVGLEASEFKAIIRPSECFFTVQHDTVEIIIQVANFFDTRLAGIDDRMTLSTQAAQIKSYHQKMFLFLSSFAVMFFIGIYHLLLWFVRRDQKVNLHFAFLSIIMSVLSIWIGDKSIYYLIPNMPLELYYRIWYSFLILVPIFLLYLRDIFPKEVNNKIVYLCILVYSLYLAMVMLMPKEFYIKATYFFLIITLLFIAYYPYVIIRAVKNDRRYSVWVMAGMVIGLIASFNDILFALGWITTGYYMPVGFLACVLSQSIVISVEFSRSYRENIILRNQLQEANTELEERIQQRTQQLDIINQELKETIAAKDKFFSILSHDLKNPFFAIKLIIDQLLRHYPDIEPLKLERNLLLMSSTIQESSKILENLHIWSHLQTGKIKNNAEYILIEEIINKVIQLKELSVEQKSIKLKIDINNKLTAYADSNMLEMVIRNLLSNAIKFTPRGGSISISNKINNNTLELIISDTGIGISPNNINKLFKIEGGFHTNGTEQESGTGLGLILCHDFVQKMNGKLLVESIEGEGSKFIISLPIHNNA